MSTTADPYEVQFAKALEALQKNPSADLTGCYQAVRAACPERATRFLLEVLEVQIGRLVNRRLPTKIETLPDRYPNLLGEADLRKLLTRAVEAERRRVS